MAESRLHSSLKTNEHHPAQNEVMETVLSEVYDLLECYSPSWYSNETRERIQAVLDRSRYTQL